MAHTRNFDSAAKSSQTLSDILTSLQKAHCNRIFNTGGLAIKAGGSAVVKTVNTVNAWIDGTIVQKAAGDMAALSGSVVPTGSKNIYAFCLDSSGTLTTLAGTANATLGSVLFPTVSADKAIIGFIIVSNATGSDFTPGTTALDTGSLTVTYVDTPTAFNPNLTTLPATNL